MTQSCRKKHLDTLNVLRLYFLISTIAILVLSKSFYFKKVVNK